MLTQIITCYHCDSENIVKNGKAPNAKQKYLCHDCGRQSREEEPGSSAFAPQRREEILHAYQEQERFSPSEVLPVPSGFRATPLPADSKKPLGGCHLWSEPYCPRRLLRRKPYSSSTSRGTTPGPSWEGKPTNAGYGSPWPATLVRCSPTLSATVASELVAGRGRGFPKATKEDVATAIFGKLVGRLSCGSVKRR